MKKRLVRWLLRRWGWELIPIMKTENKCIITAAPHTSGIDFLLGKLYFVSQGVKTNFVIKKEFFFFPLGYIIKALGAIPIDRSNPRRMIESTVSQFHKNKKMRLVITPEGTRKKTTNWKKGFYYIAQKANVPVYLGKIDFKAKTMSVDKILTITENIDKDMNEMYRYYSGCQGKNKEHFATIYDKEK